MAAKLLLGEFLIEQGLVDQDTIADALRVQVSGNRRLGNILVRMGALSEDQLVDALAKQLGIEVIDVNQSISGESSRKLPRYLCKKYDAIPLGVKNNNILEVAMTDPSDQQAIRDLEQYTGHVIEARLARQSDIMASIRKHIPYSMKDFFSPESNVRFTRIAVAICLALVVVISGATYRYIHSATYGTISVTEGATIYKNLDLMLGVEENGKINLVGRGAFARGFYSASFNDPDVLTSFVESRNTDLSEKQMTWLRWAIVQVKTQRSEHSVASAK